MLRPLLYTSTRLTPLRPYSNAVLARLLHPDIDYGLSSPRWFIHPQRDDSRFESSSKSFEERSRDGIVEIAEGDRRIVFGETDFKTKRETYSMPKYVHLYRTARAEFRRL